MGLMGAIVVYLFGSMIRSIRDEQRSENLRKVWKNFGLSIAFSVLFIVSWFGQGIAQWNHFKAEQAQHNQPAEVKEFVAEFSASTLENWQSEFLQLFSFVVTTVACAQLPSAPAP
jgi:hypothetical protein